MDYLEGSLDSFQSPRVIPYMYYIDQLSYCWLRPT
jgi:hypothetical protein